MNDFIDELNTVLSENFGPDDNLILTGDFNVDVSSFNQNGSDLTNMLNSLHFDQLINGPTRVCSSSSKIIDHVWVNFQNDSIDSCVIECDITDHNVISASIPIFKESTIIK